VGDGCICVTESGLFSSFEAIDDGISLRVTDDGVGLPDSPPKDAGMGLRIMAHCASMIGATFSARRGEPAGTIVSCVLRQSDERKKIPE
jgi:signal transduction histidine kinase